MVHPGFSLMCTFHSLVALISGALMLLYTDEFFVFTHGNERAGMLSGSTPHDQLLIRTSDSFSGLLMFSIGFLLFMVASVKDREFHSFFAKGCLLLHVSMAVWRIYFQRKVQVLGLHWLRLVVGDTVLGLSWVLFLVYS